MDEHKQQAAALLAQADEVIVEPLRMPGVHPGRADPETERVERAQQRRRDLRQEALVHAVLQVADEIALLQTSITGR